MWGRLIKFKLRWDCGFKEVVDLFDFSNNNNSSSSSFNVGIEVVDVM